MVKQFFNYSALLMMLSILSGCEAIGAIFKTGVGVGVFIVVIILIIVFAVFGRSKK